MVKLDIKEYISSGVIEAYVLGMATDEEIRELESLCVQYQEVKQALEEAEDTLGRLLTVENQEQPPAAMKESIFDTLIQEGLLLDENKEANEVKEVEIHRASKINWYALTAAACMLLLVIGAIYHFNVVKELKSKIVTLTIAQRSLLAENINFMEQVQSKQEELMAVAKPSVVKYNLVGVTGHENSVATLYWDQTTKDLYLMPQGLPALPVGKQYQLWAIVDGKPVNAGVFNATDFNVLQKMIVTKRAEMFAITIENEGGAEQPTLDQMVVATKV